MEEAPVPIVIDTPKICSQTNLFNFNLEFNKNSYILSLIDIDNNKLKILINSEINEENDICKFETILELNILKTQNKYFKMFDNYEEFKKDFLDLFKPTSTKIININNNEMIIAIELMVKSDNILNITLNKIEIPEKEQISFLIKDAKNKNKKINNLNKEMKIMKNKISSLENTVKTLLTKITELEK